MKELLSRKFIFNILAMVIGSIFRAKGWIGEEVFSATVLGPAVNYTVGNIMEKGKQQ